MDSPKISCLEAPNRSPVCPHCERELREIWTRQLTSAFGRRYVYFCSHCAKVLGVSHRKGFWMG